MPFPYSRDPLFSLRGAWIYNKNLTHRETIDQQLMWQASFGLTYHNLKKGKGVFMNKKLNDSCPHIQGIDEMCPTMLNAVNAGQLIRGTDSQANGPAALTFGHFSQVKKFNFLE